MLKRIVLASRNQGKAREIEAILSDLPVEIKSLRNYPEIPDVVEDGLTFFENAYKKAKAISEQTNETALADDSGLEVDILGGAPGIYSARYAGDSASDEQNNIKLLDDMRTVPSDKRKAAFRCVIVLYEPDGAYHSFEGRWAGIISESCCGDGGFGYDPVFFLPDQGVTVAELPPEMKNSLSHRAQAMKELKQYLQQKGTAVGA